MKKDEILENKKVETNDKDYRKLLVNSIMDLEKDYYRLQKINIKYQELFDKKMKSNKKLEIIENKLNILNKKLREIDDKKEITKNQKSLSSKPFKYGQVIKLDLKYKVKTYELFILLNLEENSSKKIKIINKLKNIYFEVLRNIKKDDYNSIKTIKKILSYLNNALKQEKSKIKSSSNKSTSKKINYSNKTIKTNVDKKIDLSKDPIYNEILDGRSISMYRLKDVIDVFCEVVRKYKINENLTKVIDEIIDRLELEVSDKDVLDYLYSMIDSVKIRKYSYDKDSMEFDILKNVNKSLKRYKDRVKIINYELENKDPYKFDLITKLILDEDNYFIIKRIMEATPNIVNSKRNGVHIVLYILDQYLENYIKLLNKDFDSYVNIEFLKEIYYLFTRSTYSSVDKDTKKEINRRIYNFILRLTDDCTKKEITIDNNVYKTIFVKSDKVRKNIISQVKELSSQHYYDEKVYLKKLNMDSDVLQGQVNYICNNNIDYDEKNRVDLTGEEQLILDNPYVAYNYKKRTNSNILKISVFDISSVILNNTYINNYMYNEMLKNEELDERILDKFKFKSNKEMPTITFKITLDKSNKPLKLFIYKSRIKSNLLRDGSNMSREINKAVGDIIRIKKYDDECYNVKDIEIVIKRVLNELYLQLSLENNIPIIYYGEEKILDIEPNIYSIIGSISSKFPNEEFTKIYNKIINNIGEFHYSDKPFSVVGDFDLGLIGEPNYILLENQRLIKYFLLKAPTLSEDDYKRMSRIYNVEYDNMLIDLNNVINHKDISDFDIKKRKIKKKILSVSAF